MNSEEKKLAVRSIYGAVATSNRCGCGCSCEGKDGYEAGDEVPEEADLGLGCGNPTAMASLRPGEVVLDLGSGAGVDCFVAARQVGPEGKVIGVDMTPEMIERANSIADENGIANVEFRLGDIEALPVEGGSVDVVISNCVLNLVPDKNKAYQEIHRVLKPGGRVAISDLVTVGELSPELRQDVEAYAACVGGAVAAEEYVRMAREAGLKDVSVVDTREYKLCDYLPGTSEAGSIASIYVEARK